MEKYSGFAMIIGMCVIVLSIVAFRRKSEFIINLIFRGVMGGISIYLINQFLIWQQIDMAVGINPFTVLTTAGLGFPGVILLYGVSLYRLL